MMSLISLWKSTILALAEVAFIEILTVNASLQATVPISKTLCISMALKVQERSREMAGSDGFQHTGNYTLPDAYAYRQQVF